MTFVGFLAVIASVRIVSEATSGTIARVDMDDFQMAEMASMAPTAGGQSYRVSEFSPKSAQSFLSYITGEFL